MANIKTTPKQKKKNNSSLYIGIALMVVAVVAVVGIVFALNRGENIAQPSTISIDTSKIDKTIEYGDYDGMTKLAKDIQNGYVTGKVVKIDGIVSRPIMNYSIVEQNTDGTQKVGTQFVIDGVDESAYPADGTRVVITGEVVEQSPLYFVIKTAPEYVEAK